MDNVLGLDQLDGSMIADVGGKAANLGTLLQAGLPVPHGFCVTTDAYRLVAGQLLHDLFARLSAADGPDVPSLAAEARALIEAAPVPAELERAVLARYRELGGVPVAVRSSATAEDLQFASFAGQQDTYLNVVGDAALMTAVRRCWASLWTDRAVSYRNTHDIAHDTVALAVIVQEMVQATAAGVMFTANPVTGSRRQTVIDASPGLGEAVVSGAVNPDHFVVDTRTGAIVERRIGDKRVLIRSLPGGGTERMDRDDSSQTPALTDPEVLALSALGARAQDHYGAPQDTEWAIDEGGKLWLTQSRPITTLYPLPSAAEPSGRRAFMCMTLAQGLTRPITPMGLAAFRSIASSVATAAGSPPPDPGHGPRSFTAAGQRVFVDFTGAFRNPIGRRAMLAVFGVMEARAAAVLRTLVQDPDFALVPRSHWAAIRPVSRVVRKVHGPQRVLTAVARPERAHRAIAGLEGELRRQLAEAADATPAERMRHVQRLIDQAFWFMPRIVAYPLAGFVLLAAARRLLAGLVQPGELQTVLRSLPHNVTTEMDLELWRLSSELAADPDSRTAFTESTAAELASRFTDGDLPVVAQHGLAGFLRRYGHRAVAEIDLGMPRWSDDPTHLVGVLANYLRLDDPALAPDTQFRSGDAAAEAMVQSLVERARQKSRMRAGLVGFGLRRTRQLAGLREAPKNLLVLSLAGIRSQLQRVGADLVAQGRIKAADDIFFLDLAEVRQALTGSDGPTADLAGLVDQRKEDYAAELRRRHIPRILLSDGTEPEALAVADVHADGALVGSPASAGSVTARARVILDPVGAHLEPGEILVAPSTDPGWTPLFLTAGGLVMEMGGSNSHGAVVAREYGIPAVVGVPDATSRLETGQTVTVDGAAGLVLPG